MFLWGGVSVYVSVISSFGDTDAAHFISVMRRSGAFLVLVDFRVGSISGGALEVLFVFACGLATLS